MIGIAELLLHTPLTSEQRTYLEVIRSSGESLLHIISDVLDLSKIESQGLELEHAPFDLHRQAREALAIVRIAADEKGLEVGQGRRAWEGRGKRMCKQ